MKYKKNLSIFLLLSLLFVENKYKVLYIDIDFFFVHIIRYVLYFNHFKLNRQFNAFKSRRSYLINVLIISKFILIIIKKNNN